MQGCRRFLLRHRETAFFGFCHRKMAILSSCHRQTSSRDFWCHREAFGWFRCPRREICSGYLCPHEWTKISSWKAEKKCRGNSLPTKSNWRAGIVSRLRALPEWYRLISCAWFYVCAYVTNFCLCVHHRDWRETKGANTLFSSAIQNAREGRAGEIAHHSLFICEGCTT